MPGDSSSQEERRSPSQATIDNSVAIGQLVAIQKRTTKDVDRIVEHIEKILPIHEQIATMRKIQYGSIVVAIGFASWITLAHFALREQYTSHEAVQQEREENININKKLEEEKRDQTRKQIEEKINKNKNQIAYVKGRVK